MTVVKINAITVPADSGDELARRFATRAGKVDEQDGFEGFELLRPTDDRHVWLVVTRWRDEAAFEAWTAGQDFQRAHARAGAEGSSGDAAGSAEAPRRPVGISSEIWSYAVAEQLDG